MKNVPTHWALEDVSFSVNRGETVGILGRNGAGKSTLLKILSRITKPTRGHGIVRGSLSSLLEVGTGFHPELSGRENVFLNGAILGMRRSEILRKFAAIVEFAEISKFIDTPVKRYSSGMYVRLAFAVAAYLQSDILVVDEVLAVGDASFQKRCLSKMDDAHKEGRTVLFVSHSMPSVTRLCQRAILLEGGRVAADGPSSKVVAEYLKGDQDSGLKRVYSDPEAAPGDATVRLKSVSAESVGLELNSLDIRQPLELNMEYAVLQSGHALTPNFSIHWEDGTCAFITMDLEPQWRGHPKQLGVYTSTCIVPGNFLSEGTYYISAGISTQDPYKQYIWERDILAFQVVDSFRGDSARGDYAGNWPGVIRPKLDWKTAYAPDASFEVTSPVSS